MSRTRRLFAKAAAVSTASILGALTLCAASPSAAEARSYKISVKTCDRAWAGTDSTVTVAFGSGSSWTPDLKMDHKFHNDFRRDEAGTYVFSGLPFASAPVGMIRLNVMGMDSWCLERASVSWRNFDAEPWAGGVQFVLNDWLGVEWLHPGTN